MKKIIHITQYNIHIFPIAKLIPIIISLIILNAFNIYKFYKIKGITLLDVIILQLGGFEFNISTFLLVASILLPYFLFAYLIELYLSECMGVSALYIILRIGSYTKWIFINYILIIIMNLVYFFIYDCLIFGTAMYFFKGVYIGVNFIEYHPQAEIYFSLFNIFINVYIIQVIGSILFSMFQVLITLFSKKYVLGYAIVAIIYIYNLTTKNQLWFLNNIKLFRYKVFIDCNTKHSILHYCIINIVLIIITVIYTSYYLKKKKIVFEVI